MTDALRASKKRSTDEFEWYGIEKIRENLISIVKEKDLSNPLKSLDVLIPSEKKVEIGKLTVSLILCFLALRECNLGIQNVACFLSRHNDRYDTTLCKLYQIAHILVQLGVIERKATPSELNLASPYKDDWCQPYSSSHGSDSEVPEFIINRRIEFKSYVRQNASDNTGGSE